MILLSSRHKEKYIVFPCFLYLENSIHYNILLSSCSIARTTDRDDLCGGGCGGVALVKQTKPFATKINPAFTGFFSPFRG